MNCADVLMFKDGNWKGNYLCDRDVASDKSSYNDGLLNVGIEKNNIEKTSKIDVKMSNSNESQFIMKYENISNNQATTLDYDDEIAQFSMVKCNKSDDKTKIVNTWQIVLPPSVSEKKIANQDTASCDENPDEPETAEKMNDITYQQILRSNMTYICQICNRHYRSQSRALIHINKVHSITNFDAINYCTSTDRTAGVLWEPIKLSLDDQIAELVKRREEYHFQYSPYRCYSCAMAFNFPETLERHNLKHHKNAGSYMCDICMSQFGNESELKRHERYHRDRYKCSICGYLLKSHTFISTRFAHEATHSRTIDAGDQTVFVCNYCNDTFQDQKLLGAHMRCAHFFPDVYRCTICKRVLTTKCGYKIHMSTHSNKKRYQCKLCDMSFKSVGKKRKHILTHYKFVCDHCDQVYPTKNKLKEHIQNDHSC